MDTQTHELKIERPTNIKDKLVISQVPPELLQQLGEPTGKDYCLKYSKRTLLYKNGSIEYWPYKTRVIITINPT